MWNKALFKQLAKSNLKLFLIISGVLCLLITMIMSIFDPSAMEMIREASKDAPINPLGDISTLTAFVANQYFGMMALILVMIYAIILGNRLIAEKVDKGSMAYDLSTPTTRSEITATSAIYLVSTLVVMFVLIFGIGFGVAEYVQPGGLDIGIFFPLVSGAFLLQFAISGIVYFSSCFFNRSIHSLALSAGLSVFFFAANLLSGMSDRLEFLKNFSLITLFDSDSIIHGNGYMPRLILLGVIGCALYILGIAAFKRKDLPL